MPVNVEDYHVYQFGPPATTRLSPEQANEIDQPVSEPSPVGHTVESPRRRRVLRKQS